MLTLGLELLLTLLVFKESDTTCELRVMEKREALRVLEEGSCRAVIGELGMVIGSLRMREIARASAMSSTNLIGTLIVLSHREKALDLLFSFEAPPMNDVISLPGYR